MLYIVAWKAYSKYWAKRGTTITGKCQSVFLNALSDGCWWKQSICQGQSSAWINLLWYLSLGAAVTWLKNWRTGEEGPRMRILVSEQWHWDHFLTHFELPWASAENSEVFMKPFLLLLSTIWSFTGRIDKTLNVRYSCASLVSRYVLWPQVNA